jgi:hypothetical protein
MWGVCLCKEQKKKAWCKSACATDYAVEPIGTRGILWPHGGRAIITVAVSGVGCWPSHGVFCVCGPFSA